MPDPIDYIVTETTFLSGFGEWTFGITDSTAKRTWYLQCSRQPTFEDDGTAAASLLPVAVGAAYKAGDSRNCQKITIKAIAGDLTGLYAEAEYSHNTIDPNPLLRKDRVSLEVAGETQDWFLDADDKPSVNSAGEIFEKIPPRTTGGVKLIIEGNRSTLPAAAMVDLSRPHRTNGGPITVRGISIPTGSAKLTGCSGSESSENGVTFYVVRWELTLAETWEIDFDDRGFNELDGTAGKLKQIVVAGAPTAVSYPLDGSGKKKAKPGDAPAKVHRKPYKPASFSFGWTAAA